MIFGNDRNNLRRMWFEVYRKAQAGEPLTALEEQVKAVIALHPEYYAMLSAPDQYADRDYLPEFGETNPFLHMGLHMGLREQISTNRPAGMQSLYQQFLLRFGDKHDVEHQMMEALAHSIWLAQRENRAPNEQAYLDLLRARLQ